MNLASVDRDQKLNSMNKRERERSEIELSDEGEKCVLFFLLYDESTV